VWKKNFRVSSPLTTARSYPHTEDDRPRLEHCRRSEAALGPQPVIGCLEILIRLRPVSRPGYGSSVCSTPEAAAEAALGDLARAIEELAADNQSGAASGQLAERIARLWGMVTDLDPELARRRLGYEQPTDG
jgi:hypothetical protein